VTPDCVFSVVTATRRRPAALGRLLAALERQTVPWTSFSVTVVNDGSHDAAYARVLEGFPFARYHPLPRRAGPAAARNHGASTTSGEWLVFTDDDCVPPPDWLERLRPHQDADVVGGLVELAPGANLTAVGRYLRDIRFIRPMRGPDGDILCLPSANLAVRRSWFKTVRGFDPRFPRAGGEDLDLTYRLAAAGAKLAVADSWVTRHDAPEGLGALCARYFRYGRGESLFRRLRGGEGLPPQVSYLRRLKALLGLAGKAAGARAAGDLSFRLLTVTRQVSYETGRLSGSFRLW